MTVYRPAFVAGALIASVFQANADLYIYEPFDYAPTNSFNNGAYLGDGNQAGGLGLGMWGQNDNNGNDGVGSYPSALAPVNEADISNGGLSYSDGFGNDLPVAGNAWERANRTGQAASYASIDAAATAGLTADNTSIWMTFLFQDRGFSGPDFGIGLASETMVGDDNQGLGNWASGTKVTTAGYGVGFGITASSSTFRNIHTVVYDNSVNFTKVNEATATFDGPGASGIRFLAMKVNWNEFGTPDEIFVFDLTGYDLSLGAPDESAALASDTFDWTLAQQQSLDVFNISDTQVANVDEIRVATDFVSAVGGIVPEPSSLAAIGVAGVLVTRRRRV